MAAMRRISKTLRASNRASVSAMVSRKSATAVSPQGPRGRPRTPPLVRLISHQQGQDGLLSVEAVLRLVEDYRPRPLEDLVHDLLAPVGGQVVHADGGRWRLGEKLRVHLVPGEGPPAP